MREVNILGVKIDNLKEGVILKKIRLFLDGNEPKFCTTPNPEIILTAESDEEMYYILNSSDLSIADGVGLKLAGFFLGKNIKIYPGADLTEKLLTLAEKRKLQVCIINRADGLSSKSDIRKALNKKYENLKFDVVDTDIASLASSSRWTMQHLSEGENRKLERADILFCTLGAPLQEKVIFYTCKRLPKLKLAIGVGGSFDFLTGRTTRAPKVFRLIGMEWLWRLLIQPTKRARRIFNAVFVFPIKFFKYTFLNKYFYRPNAACMLYKRVSGKVHVMLVNRNENNDHWQLPQGGRDGRSVERTGRAELAEELGVGKFETRGIVKNVYRYKYGTRNGRTINRGHRVVKRRGYKGQKQDLYIAEFMGEDKDVRINPWEHNQWKWADLDNLVSEVHPIRKDGIKHFIEKFRTIIDK